MELLIITAVHAYEKDIKRLLKKHEVKSFSYLNVTGYKDMSLESKDDNWFATSAGENRSTLFYVFIEQSKVDEVLAAMAGFNEGQDSESHVHAVSVNVNKSI